MNVQQFYTFLPIMIRSCSSLGFLSGFMNAIHDAPLNKHHIGLVLFTNVVGFTGLGILTGMTYPISIPLFTYYVISQKI